MLREWIENLGFERVVEVESTTIIAPGIAIVGPLHGPPHEQALAINLTNCGLVLAVRIPGSLRRHREI